MARKSKTKMTALKTQSPAWPVSESRNSKRAFNRSLVCASLFHNGPRSRVELQETTGLPLSRLSDICGELLREGVIRESMTAPAAGKLGGRPRSMLELDLRRLGVACVRYDDQFIRTAIVDLAGAVHWKREWNIPAGADANVRLRTITKHLMRAIEVAPTVGVNVVGVGAADPGIVDVSSGRSISAVNVPGWKDVPVVEHLTRFTGFSAVIERGDGWAALGEAAFGAGRGSQHVLFVMLMEGIGGGIVEGGRLLSGRDGSAGEIGHTRISRGGPLCGCGARGCLEAYIAPSRLAALWRGALASELDKVPLRVEAVDDDFSKMLVAAQGGDGRARSVLATAAQDLAIAIGNAVSLLNPERIVLGGRFVAAGDSFLALLRQALPECALAELAANVDLRLAERGEDSAFLGIAAHIRSRLLAFPSIGGAESPRLTT